MHTSTMLLSPLFILATTTTAYMAPLQPPNPHILPRSASPDPSPSSLQEKCTFTLWHKQLSSPQSASPPSDTRRTNYIYLPRLTDHANNLVIDIAATKPAHAHNSYTRVSETQKFSVKGLLGDAALIISGRDGNDTLVFETQQLKWVAASEGGVSKGAEAWCQVQEWVESGLANRVSLVSFSRDSATLVRSVIC